KRNLICFPSRRRPQLFLGPRAPPWPARARAAVADSLPPGGTPEMDQFCSGLAVDVERRRLASLQVPLRSISPSQLSSVVFPGGSSAGGAVGLQDANGKLVDSVGYRTVNAMNAFIETTPAPAAPNVAPPGNSIGR